MTNKKKRDFIASEIMKRIIGPGYTEGVFVCKSDASDEILDNRPIVMYTGGILYPQKSNVADEIKEDEENSDIDEIQTDNDKKELFNDGNNTDIGEEEYADVDAESSRPDKESNQLDLGIADRADFKPSHIGMIFCVSEETKCINVDVKYGIYHVLDDTKGEDNDIIKNVKVKLGRCSLEQLRKTFSYYDGYANVLTEIELFGAHRMEDLFYIDEENLTISPRRIFKRIDNQTNKEIFLQATSFPDIPRNKVAYLLIKLFNNPTKNMDLPIGLDWNQVSEVISEVEKLPELENLLQSNGWSDIKNNLSYDSDNNQIRITCGAFNIPEGVDLYGILVIDDPVKSHLLPLLLQYRYFKREQKTLKTYSLPLNHAPEPYLLPDSDNTLKLHWKSMLRTDHNGTRHKYVQILLENIKTKTKKQQAEDFIHQTELKVSSPGILSYSEPHRSSIADKEYDVNEILYSDIKVYAKGVNCGAKWNITEKAKEVMTTYTPSQLSVAFNPESSNPSICEACDVFDLTIWSTLTKDEILNRFTAVAEAYKEWHKAQIELASKNNVLDDILNEQKEFVERLFDNIAFLKNNDAAYRCFKIANTAMYIQMVISRDPYFKKNRDMSEYLEDALFNDSTLWNRFQSGGSRPKYRPFQLAFLLMNVKSTFENDDTYRNDNVDLIWFPTGGGKTEAYLALTALTIAHRRSIAPDDVGVSVVMRYTLRLLTAQQFERASFLICAMEYLRRHMNNDELCDSSLGNNPITIGMWIGKASSPNRYADLGNGKYNRFMRYLNGQATNISSANPFPVSYCPWCGCKMLTPGVNGRFINGYDRLNPNGIHCINQTCTFHDNLPIMFIDEQLYNTPPTLLFATVDKFAQLKDKKTGELFGLRNNQRRSPDLIIQDELHLISGPLGSLVGMYESMVEEVCTERNNNGEIVRRPKIIASTATTRNTQRLIKQLYTRNVRSFPVSGVRYNDNFFSEALPQSESKRLYLGVAPTGHSASELEIRTIAAQIIAKEILIVSELKNAGVDLNNIKDVTDYLIDGQKPNSLKADFDDYWTLVLYYNNLKSLGRAHSRIGQEIKSNAESMRGYLDEFPSLDFIGANFHQRTEEFTSRQESSRIKELLVDAEARTSLVQNGSHRIHIKSNMDIVQATNMISVGIDISRWNTMMIIGQPLTTAEYIQSSSRVGRREDGLVINLYNPLRTRELSFYENYLPYHEVFYKHVEPLMATTFTEQTINKLITNIYLCYMSAVKGYTRNGEVSNGDKEELKNLLINRFKKTAGNAYFGTLEEYIEDEVDKVYGDFNQNPQREFWRFLNENNNLSHPLMNSLRDIESDTYIYYNI